MSTGHVELAYAPSVASLMCMDMDEELNLRASLNVRLRNVRGVWVVDAYDFREGKPVTIPSGISVREATELLESVARESGDGYGKSWRMPPLSTSYLCDDGKTRTIGQMLEGISPDQMPQDDIDLTFLLSCYGCDWTKPLVVKA